MPTNQPVLSLGSGPRGVHDARQWVVEQCHVMGRPELVECAELGVSELVTNALLHGLGPIEVHVGGTQGHPRVEVRDASTEPPVLPAPLDLDDEDDLLTTFGRGLSIVARSSTAWGAHIDEDGKVVWFEPAAEFADDPGADGQVTGIPEGPSPAGEHDHDLLEFALHGVPVKSFAAFQRHYRELRREVRLLALAHEAAYPLAKNLSDLFGTLERPLTTGLGTHQIQAALGEGQAHADLRVQMPRESALGLERFVELLDLADAFCREERLLSLARTPDQRAFQQWFLREFVRQAGGAAPTPWPDTTPQRLQRSSVS